MKRLLPNAYYAIVDDKVQDVMPNKDLKVGDVFVRLGFFITRLEGNKKNFFVSGFIKIGPQELGSSGREHISFVTDKEAINLMGEEHMFEYLEMLDKKIRDLEALL